MLFIFVTVHASQHDNNKVEKNIYSIKSIKNYGDSTALDTIIMLGGRKKLVNVKNVSRTNIYYTEPGDNKSKDIRRKDVRKILYESGKVEVYNKPILQMVDETNWEAVYLTNDKSEVEGLFKRAEISSESSTSVRSKKAAKRNATVRLQKKAAAKGANVILITREEAIGGYGDLPGYEMAGIAYSFEPPPVGESEEKD